jgi:hypothetical protein
MVLQKRRRLEDQGEGSTAAAAAAKEPPEPAGAAAAVAQRLVRLVAEHAEHRNVRIVCAGGEVVETNALLGAATSPVLEALLLRFSEAGAAEVALPTVPAAGLEALLAAVGTDASAASKDRPLCVAGPAGAAAALAAADYLQVPKGLAAVARLWAAADLDQGHAVELVTEAEARGLEGLAQQCVEYVGASFSAFAASAAFPRLSQSTLVTLLENDNLVVASEEAVLDAVLVWLGAEQGRVEVAGPVLIPLLRLGALPIAALQRASTNQVLTSDKDTNLVLQTAIAALHFPGAVKPVPRQYSGAWVASSALERTLIPSAAGKNVLSVLATASKVCCGDNAGTVTVLNAATLEHVREFSAGSAVRALLANCRLYTGCGLIVKIWSTPWALERTLTTESAVNSLLMHDGVLLAGTISGTIAVWDAKALWERQPSLLSHTDSVRCLVVAGDTILSASEDKTLKVWALQDRTLTRTVDHPGRVYVVVVSQDKVFTGCRDRKVRVFCRLTWTLLHTLDAPSSVYALALYGSTLLSAGGWGHLSAWCTTSWERTALEGGGEAPNTVNPGCLSVHAGTRSIYVGRRGGALQLWRPPA